jgi:hypothetical protein
VIINWAKKVPSIVTHDSRSALSRANFFLAKAVAAKADERVEFEAFVEAAIIFGRTAVHRFKTKYESHPKWKAWWKSIPDDPHVVFFRSQRDMILKEAPPKIGQRIWAPFIGPGGVTVPGYVPSYAREFYYFDQPDVLATDTVGAHLNAVEALLTDAENLFT